MKLPEPRHWRVDRWLTLGAARPLAGLRGAAANEPVAVPVLMYHSVAADVDTDVHPYLRTVTSPATFARQVAQLAARGLRGASLAEVAGALATDDAQSVRGRVVITFDDGYRDFLEHAWPVLRARGFGATVFLATGFLGRDFVNHRPCLSAAEVRSLATQGVEFGSHTVNHPKLVELGDDAIRRELVDSRRAIEDLCGRRIDLFSYPYRFPQEDAGFARRFASLLGECGYRAGVTTVIGRAAAGEDVRFLPRLPVNDCDDVALLAAKLDGHYDWLRSAQTARKRVRALLAPRSAA